MGKRSSFPKVDRNLWSTPAEAVPFLIPHIPRGASFFEPCAAYGILIRHLVAHGLYSFGGCDLVPMDRSIQRGDALQITDTRADFFITNPPWDREILHRIIEHLSNIAPTWLLFDADWPFTAQDTIAKHHGVKTVTELMRRCKKIVAVGRLCWVPSSKKRGKDNCAWYLFEKGHHKTEFIEKRKP